MYFIILRTIFEFCNEATFHDKHLTQSRTRLPHALRIALLYRAPAGGVHGCVRTYTRACAET